MQSPKSKRPHAPGEMPATDNNPVQRSGGQTGRQGSGMAKSKAHVPRHSATGPSGAGNVQSGYSAVSTSPSAPSQAGKPGYVDAPPEARKSPSGGNACSYPRGHKR